MFGIKDLQSLIKLSNANCNFFYEGEIIVEDITSREDNGD